MTDIPASAFTATGQFTIASLKLPPQYLTIGPHVRISLDDGSLEYGDSYQPDEAARTFWDAMSSTYSSALAAIERVRAIHYRAEYSNVRCEQGGWCIGCDPTGSEFCSENPWPCPTIQALEQP